MNLSERVQWSDGSSSHSRLSIIRICQVEGQTWILLQTLERALKGVLDQFCTNSCDVQVVAIVSKKIGEDKLIIWRMPCV